MADLFPYLLREENPQSFGVGLESIIVPKRNGVMMKKLVVYFNGEKQEPLEISNVELQFNNNEIILRIDSIEEENKDAAIDLTSGIIPLDAEEIPLTGTNLEMLEKLSELRKNKVEKSDNQIQHIIETSLFAMRDVQSIDQAIAELITAERDLITKGYKALEVKLPKFVFTDDSEQFKLVQACVICKE
jgi:hypothetical protein